jgi:tRNA dimethylallyltransferase
VKAILLMGPTASGKTAVALALAKRVPVEIVSVDSAQVYRGMDVGTAKPSRAERDGTPHHLIDILHPTESYSAGSFRHDALRVAQEIHARGRVPVFAGGTMLYFKALTSGIAELPRADAAIRQEIEVRAARAGWPALHAELARIDPASAARIGPTDPQRIQRALEVWQLAGVPLSRLQERAAAKPPELPFEALRVALEPSERTLLHARIAGRFHAMLEAGLLRELEELRGRYALTGSMPSMRAVGYRQAWETIEGRASTETLAPRGIAATRQLAKRQLTWLRSMPSLERYDCLRPELAETVGAKVEEFLSPRRGT